MRPTTACAALFGAALCSASMLAGSAFAESASAPGLTTDEFRVPAVDPGIQLYVRNKHPEGVTYMTAGLKSCSSGAHSETGQGTRGVSCQ